VTARRLASLRHILVLVASLSAWLPITADAAGPSSRWQAGGCAKPVRVTFGSASDETPVDARWFRWWAQPGLERLAEVLASQEAVFGPLPGVGRLDSALPAPPAIYLVNDLECLEALGLGGALPDWVAGVASGDGSYLALRADPGRTNLGSLRVTLRHELAHLALRAATDGNVPRWLNEGYAQYAAGGWDWQEAWRLRLLMLRGGQGVLQELSLRFPSDPQRARMAYLLSYTAVHEMVRLGGEAGLTATFQQLRSGATSDEALRRVFGLTESQFEARWKRTVTQRYGVLYVISRATFFWIAVTFLLLWLGWRRRRRDRAKMADLKEAERLEEELHRQAAENAARSGDLRRWDA
jgi:hypothetical protein